MGVDDVVDTDDDVVEDNTALAILDRDSVWQRKRNNRCLVDWRYKDREEVDDELRRVEIWNKMEETYGWRCH